MCNITIEQYRIVAARGSEEEQMKIPPYIISAKIHKHLPVMESETATTRQVLKRAPHAVTKVLYCTSGYYIQPVLVMFSLGSSFKRATIITY